MRYQYKGVWVTVLSDGRVGDKVWIQYDGSWNENKSVYYPGKTELVPVAELGR